MWTHTLKVRKREKIKRNEKGERGKSWNTEVTEADEKRVKK